LTHEAGRKQEQAESEGGAEEAAQFKHAASPATGTTASRLGAVGLQKCFRRRRTMPTSFTEEFSGKRALVTGGTKGAGKAIADRFLQGGATVVITARAAPEEKTESYFLQADVSTSEGTATVIREMLDRFKGVDIIVHKCS
jgi:3-oxoacyl-ACP reductase-like protein